MNSLVLCGLAFAIMLAIKFAAGDIVKAIDRNTAARKDNGGGHGES